MSKIPSKPTPNVMDFKPLKTTKGNLREFLTIIPGRDGNHKRTIEISSSSLYKY